MGLRQRLEGGYLPTLAIALIALVPYIVVTSGAELYEPQIGAALHCGKTALTLASMLSTAAYAFGALLGGDLVSRFRKHRLFLLCEVLAAAAWAGAAVATGPVAYTIASVVQGLATGILLIVALPPVIQNFAAGRLPVSAAFVDIGLFGGVAAGPLVGGAVAAWGGWRLLYAGIAAASLIAALLAVPTIPDEPPAEPGLRFDRVALLLALSATVLPFAGVAFVTPLGLGSPRVFLPLAGGGLCIVALLLFEYHHPDPLAPVNRMWHAWPVIGTLVAMFGGGVFVTLMRLLLQLMPAIGGLHPLAAGAFFWPQLGGAMVASTLFGALLRSRWTPALVLVGLAMLCAGGALVVVARTPDARSTLMLATALLGFGAGATVSPGLFLAGFAVPVASLARIFALIEMVRSVADFLIAPIMVALAHKWSHGTLSPDGIAVAAGVSATAAAVAALICLALYRTSDLCARRPDLEAWLAESGAVALTSPALMAAIRRA